MTTWLSCLDAAQKGPWAHLADPLKAANRATTLARAAGWIGPEGVLPSQASLDRLVPWLVSLTPETARDYIRRAKQAVELGTGVLLSWPEVRGKGRRRSRALDPTETRALLGSFDPMPGSFASWLLLTGARPGEAMIALWRDVDHGTWRVMGTKTPHARRVLPLDDAHRRVLPSRGRPSERIWPMSDWRWRQAWHTAIQKSGLTGPDLVPYVLRHTFATRALERGKTYEEVGAWLGHSNGDTLRRHYRHAVAPMPGLGELVAEGVL